VNSKNFGQEWTTLDALGNWSNFKQDNDGNGTWELDQTRTHNKANELSTATSWATSSHSLAGNMITAPDPANLANSLLIMYDAWNRIVKISDQSLNVVGEYEYDGLNRRIVKIDRKANPDVTYDYYLNESWQTLEVRKDAVTVPLEEYVWHPYYVDALAVRGYDADTNGAGAQLEHYYAHDANFNVVAVFGSTGTVLDRYQYSPYGAMTVLDPNFAVDSDNLTDIANSCGYTGRQFDGECGLCYYRNRCYHGQAGLFVGRDPIGYRSLDPNLYRYVSSNPMAFVDPSGTTPPIILGGNGTIASPRVSPLVRPNLRPYVPRNVPVEPVKPIEPVVPKPVPPNPFGSPWQGGAKPLPLPLPDPGPANPQPGPQNPNPNPKPDKCCHYLCEDRDFGDYECDRESNFCPSIYQDTRGVTCILEPEYTYPAPCNGIWPACDWGVTTIPIPFGEEPELDIPHVEPPPNQDPPPKEDDQWWWERAWEWLRDWEPFEKDPWVPEIA
jgi:RHS repeat-associated protein